MTNPHDIPHTANRICNFTFQIISWYQCLSPLYQFWYNLFHTVISVTCLCWGIRLHSCAIICKSVNITMPAQQPDLRPSHYVQLLWYHLRPGHYLQLLWSFETWPLPAVTVISFQTWPLPAVTVIFQTWPLPAVTVISFQTWPLPAVTVISFQTWPLPAVTVISFENWPLFSYCAVTSDLATVYNFINIDKIFTILATSAFPKLFCSQTPFGFTK
jgi:hypothetical protein